MKENIQMSASQNAVKSDVAQAGTANTVSEPQRCASSQRADDCQKIYASGLVASIHDGVEVIIAFTVSIRAA